MSIHLLTSERMGRRLTGIDLVVVDQQMLKQRIDAARALRGVTQAQLNKLFEADGLGKHDVGRLERGELPLRRIHLDALIRHLRVPEWWFTQDEIEFPDAHPTFQAYVRQVLEVVMEQVRPNWRELLRPPEGIARPHEETLRNGPSLPESDTPPEDPEPPRP